MSSQRAPSAIHILRALLRECTYLPDPAARTYWHARIVSRFREYCPRKTTLPWWERPPGPKRKVKIAYEAQRVTLFHQARKLLSILTRANAGHPDPLEKVLAHTYGRAGKRRHELLVALEKLDVPSDQDVVKQLAMSLANKHDSGQIGLLPHTVELVVKAQRAQREVRLSRMPMKTLQPDIPKVSSWGRPFPVNRARNVEKKWRAKAMDSVLPPLPQNEWERLRDLASGKLKWGGVVPRRGKDLWTPERVNGENPHKLTARYMRRLWVKIFVQCPIIIWDTKAGAWVVHWGKASRGGTAHSASEKLHDNTFLFEGVDDGGKRLKPR
ncbi:hypothetical protein MMC18_005485 [Xylographa bjoerkii]|nr:hypothetical protein [Xylographa bjoerkii]